MPIIEDLELWWQKLDPKYPSKKFNKENPTWELQVRMDTLEKKREFDALKIKTHLIVEPEGSPNEGEPVLNSRGKKQWRVNLRKKSIKEGKNGEPDVPAKPVEVVDGDNEPVDPNTIGNGSIGSVKLFQYDFPREDSSTGIGTMLMAVQVNKHLVYTPKPREPYDSFDKKPTERIVLPVEGEKKEEKPKSSVPAMNGFDQKPEEAF